MDLNEFQFVSKPIHIKPIAGGTQDAYEETWVSRGCLALASRLARFVWQIMGADFARIGI